MSAGQLVLLSGGLDSTVCLALAAREAPPLVTLSFDYGQRHRIELERAATIAAHYRAEPVVVSVDPRPWAGSTLTDPEATLPAADPSRTDIPATYVPARNIVFTAVALGAAEARGLRAVWLGVNAIDYSGYPDCRPELVDALRRVAQVGQKRGVEGDPVQIHAPLVAMAKAHIVELGAKLRAPLKLTWSCYRGGPAPCGACDACALRARGFAVAGIADPALSPARADNRS